MANFHNIMKRYRWGVHFLSFIFGVAETSAFSCYKVWGNHGESNFFHSDFKDLLASSFLKKVKTKIKTIESTSTEPMRLRSCTRRSTHVYISFSYGDKRTRRVYRTCRGRDIKK
jgi:hypothetical protein